MKQKILDSMKHPLISGSIIMFSGSLLGSVLNFLFNLFMSRNLTVADYGSLASLTALFSLALVVGGSAVPMIVNFAAHYFAINDESHVRGLFKKIALYYFLFGFLVLLLFIIFPKQIGNFFNIHQTPLLILCGFSILIASIGIVNSSLLQAKLSFRFITINNFISILIKLLFGILFFFIGWGVTGAMGALLLGMVVTYIISFYPLKFLFHKQLATPNINMKELFLYGAPAAIALFGVTSFISTDIILVKHFFSPTNAGIYAGLSLVGKVIFFLTATIPTVMFPLISQKHAKKEGYDNTFLLSLLIVLIPSIAITVFYFMFPEFSITIFIKKKEYLQAKNLLGFYGIFITLYSLLNVMTNFYLSIKKTIIWIPITIAALLQITLLWLYHHSFLQVILISSSILTILFMLLLLYYFNIFNNEKN